jgi:hypothetical protein
MKPTLVLAQQCPDAKNHTPCPEGYMARYDWAQAMMKAHRQIKCPGCGLYKIWVSKTLGKRVRQPRRFQTCLT